MNMKYYNSMALALRSLSLDCVQEAKSGHPGMPCGMADVAVVLFSEFLRFNPKEPNWAHRDRFVLSSGHGSPLLYSILYLTGYITLQDLKNFRKKGSNTPGHPEVGETLGVEATTGPLGQGFATATGIALGISIDNSHLEDSNHKSKKPKVYVMVGDGCLMEGISHEAASFAGHFCLENLIVLFDDNSISIDGSTNLTESDDTSARFRAYGWHTIEANGHDFSNIRNALQEANTSNKPTIISFKTIIGKGCLKRENSSSAHSGPFGNDEILKIKESMGIENLRPFEVQEDAIIGWKEVSKRFASFDTPKSPKNKIIDDFIPWNEIYALSRDVKLDEATRTSSGRVIDFLSNNCQSFISGSSDLTPSNLTKAKIAKPITANDKSGNYIHYGIREHGMAAIMNGLALYGFIPCGGTFLAFADYARPAMRVAALSKLRVIYVMTHDSIGVGEDGPTHQPVEHLASLRAIPNLNVFRPCDPLETAVSWQLAVKSIKTPSVLALSRQALENCSTYRVSEANMHRGAYVFFYTSEAPDCADIIVFSSGSEISLALKTVLELKKLGITCVLISMLCMEIFNKQDQEYRESVLMRTINPKAFRVSFEAGIDQCWHRYVGCHGIHIGVEHFGISAPADEVFKHFKLTKEFAIEKILDALSKRKT